MQFNALRAVCVVLPKQVVAVGTNLAFVNPIVENLNDGCSMWHPKPEDSDVEGQ